MLVCALVLGYAFPSHPFKGWVHSVFHHAINIRQEDGALITLVTASEDDLPQGARLNGPPGLNFLETGATPGQRVVCWEWQVRWDALPLQVDLHTAKTWCCNFSYLPDTGEASIQSEALKLILNLLEEHSLREPAGLHPGMLTGVHLTTESALNHRAGEVMHDLIHATRLGRAIPEKSIQQLVGLGPGLTPSGDDFLVGFLAGLWGNSVHHPHRRDFTLQLGRVICSTAHEQTGEISYTYLFHAARGQFSRRLFELVRLLFIGAPGEQVLHAARAVLSGGHTSGRDMLIGLLAGLIPWGQAPIFPPDLLANLFIKESFHDDC
uniref:DUF2877 domain-containing protein n=1 Tax=Anaerolinea thermolimosa TaxID=229919 RepID=A0A7C4KG43_9CHLR